MRTFKISKATESIVDREAQIQEICKQVLDTPIAFDSSGDIICPFCDAWRDANSCESLEELEHTDTCAYTLSKMIQN